MPHNHEPNAVVYTGTHDNDTTLGGTQLNPEQRPPHRGIPRPARRSTSMAVRPLCPAVGGALAIIPMQDILMLGSEHRMNRPGTEQGNWQWRFSWDQLSEELPRKMARLTALYGR